ncbi:hypothetical protein T45_01338 [Streptomyces turgidiscabies]|nr:hypothetical protein T45_01338 [Streptomyces turgidiscabies]
MAVTVAVRVTAVVIGTVGVTRPLPMSSAARSGAVSTAGTPARSATAPVAGSVPVPLVPVAGVLPRARAVIVLVPVTCSGARPPSAAGHGKRAELTGAGPLGAEPLVRVTRSGAAASDRPRSGPVAAIDPASGAVPGTLIPSGRSAWSCSGP